MTPMRRHLTAVGVWIPGRADRGKQLLERCHSQLETKRAIAIVGIKPIVARLQDHTGGDEYGFMSGAAYLKEYFVLGLELYFLVVEPAREIHRAIHLKHLRRSARLSVRERSQLQYTSILKERDAETTGTDVGARTPRRPLAWRGNPFR